jgi:hypothetical protein
VEPTVALALLVATTAAIRGIWSPCGLSMLSSITPMTEAGRGNRFSATAAWFVAGGVLGGISIGALAALGAGLVAVADPSDPLRWGIAAAAAVVCAGIDLGAFGVELPIFKRQVNDAWLRRYRSWVYGAGFGWQIGFGVATYIMTAGVFLTIALAVLSASPASALIIGATFGLVRGLAVYVGRTGTTPAALGRIHERLDALAPASRAAAAGSQVIAAVVLAALSVGPAAALVVLGAAAVLVVIGPRMHGNRPAAA